ncbi:MAG: hypothetical protein JXA95_02195 [Spirochaetales bacterium]|nr:hypothetical protein [Spirochaetales bacterium]
MRRKITGLLFFFFIAAMTMLANGRSDRNMTDRPENNSEEMLALFHTELEEIHWTETGNEHIDGWLLSESGRFELSWKKKESSQPLLMTRLDGGSGEAPTYDLPLYILNPNDDISIVFRLFEPLLNSDMPAELRLVAAVSGEELYSAAGSGYAPYISSPRSAAQRIGWKESPEVKNEISYFCGTVRSESGKLNIYWKERAGHSPELVTLESPGAGELPPEDKTVFIWKDRKRGLSFLFSLFHPLLNQKGVTALSFMGCVETDDLFAPLN